MHRKKMYSELVAQFKSLGTFNQEGFSEAIKAGCQDMTVRTMKKKTSSPVTRESLKDYLSDNKKYKDDKSLLQLLLDYFKSPVKSEEEYDRWHEDACSKVMQCMEQYYKPESVTYGKAQKVVNISMKHICCLSGAEEYYDKDYFKHCHVALDSFILEWVYRKTKQKTFDSVQQICRDNFITWSNISKEERVRENGKRIFTYSDIQKIIRNLIDLKGLTPFEAEFYVWHQMQQAMAAEALFDSESAGISIDEFKKKSLDRKIELLKALLQNIEYPYYLV